MAYQEEIKRIEEKNKQNGQKELEELIKTVEIT
jgi:hypothetical protein